MSDVLDRSLHGVAIYNPRLLSKQELIGFFVARHAELERLVEALRREAKAQPQHHLVVGARGMGKTTLLNRLRCAIEDDQELASRCLGLVFPEEQYNVVRLADFWLNCVDALADGLESSGRLGLVEGLDDAVEEIQALPRHDERGQRALDLLCRLSDRLGRRLVLLVDNVDLVLDRLKDEQWALREVLSSEARIQLVGATSAPLESHYRHDMAFYDFFRVHHLEGLDDEETFTVLRRLAEATGHDHVAQLLDDEPGRVKTIRLMAGGNPRTVVLLFSVLAQGTDGDVRTDLERLLDQCTPLYKHRLDVLSTQAQQVVDALAKHWAPATASRIADATHLHVNVVSTQLDRLVKDGTVEKVALHDTKRQGFQIAERFFNIWCLMRASRRIRLRLTWLVEFLRLMFGAEDLANRARAHLTARRAPDGIRHAELGLAFADVVGEDSLRTALEIQSIRTLCIDPATRKNLADLLDLKDQDRHLIARTERIRLLAEAHDAIFSASIELPNWSPESYWELLGGSLVVGVQEKHRIAHEIHTWPTRYVESHMTALRHESSYLAGGFVKEEFDSLTRAVREGDIDASTPIRDELEAAAVRGPRAIIPCALAIAWCHGAKEVDYAWLHGEVDSSRSLAPHLLWAAEGIKRHQLFGDKVGKRLSRMGNAHHWGSFGLNWLGNVLQDHLGDYAAAERAYELATSRNSNPESPLYEYIESVICHNLGILHYRTGAYDSAEAELRRCTSLFPDDASHWYNLAVSLYLKEADLQEAENAARRAAELDEESIKATALIAEILMTRGRWDEATRSMERAVATYDRLPSPSSWLVVLQLFSTAVARDLAAKARAFLTSQGVSDRWQPLTLALEIIERNDAALLRSLAPEVREAVRLVLANISPRSFEDGTGWVWFRAARASR